MKYLYQYRVREHISGIKRETDVKCSMFKPSFSNGILLPEEQKDLKTIGVRLLFQIMTLGKARIFYVKNENDLVHTSYVVPRCFKFPFLNKNDYEIGPCFTYPEYRGKGVYTNVLRSICQSVGNQDTVFYMIVDESNIASIKGIEKAEFTRCGTVKVSKYIKRYYMENSWRET